MSAIKVAIPVKKGKRKFHLEKGRPWSLIEQVILLGVVAKPRTVAELAAEADLPRRLVLEVLIRLMRAGWVVLSQGAEGVIFSASQRGSEVANDEELPKVSKHVSRWISFVVDQITGTLYRSRELPFVEKHVVDERAKQERFVFMKPRELEILENPGAVLDTLFDDDEKFLRADDSGDRLVDRFAIVTVRNDVVEGLPSRAPKELNGLILEAAKHAPPIAAGLESPRYSATQSIGELETDIPETVVSAFQADDIIMGGPQHEETLKKTIRNAKSRLIVHSTFIADDKLGQIFPLLHDAAKRGVVVDILWGEDEEKSGTRTTMSVVKSYREKVEEIGFGSCLRIHPFSTRSHAKIIVADDGRSGNYYALVGSCNWLSSGFLSFDVSVRLRDSKLVGKILDQMAELSRGTDGHWTELTNDFVRLAAKARISKKSSEGGTQIAVVLGPQHAAYVRKARDESCKRLFVTSHRFGAATRTAIVVPAIAAAQDRGVEVNVYYGTISGSVSNADSAEIVRSARRDGVRIQTTSEPRLHAKLLAWDDDHLIVTSQNWLSADPSDANVRREIGIYIQRKNITRIVIEGFHAIRQS